jgi:hypothetical protein
MISANSPNGLEVNWIYDSFGLASVCSGENIVMQLRNAGRVSRLAVRRDGSIL